MNLRIEHGILLKPYLAPYTRDNGGGHKIRPGWTPEHTPEMRARFDELRAERDDIPAFLIWKQVEHERGQQLARLRRPYPGWYPVGPKSDPDIVRAYRELFRRMNPESDKRVRIGNVWSGPPAVTPPDGDYVFERGEMRLVRVAPAAVKAEIDRVVSEALKGAWANE